MAFIYGDKQGAVYAPGWFLAHEECVRKTKTIFAEGVEADDYGHKHVPMGALYSVTTGEGQEAVTDYIGFLYEDVDVTAGDMPGSVVTSGVVYANRLPAVLTPAQWTALEAKGFTFIAEPAVTRPDDGTGD